MTLAFCIEHGNRRADVFDEADCCKYPAPFRSAQGRKFERNEQAASVANAPALAKVVAAMFAKTLKQTAILHGAGLHSGQNAELRICPEAAGSGIVFVRTDLPGAPSASARKFAQDAAPFRTVVKEGAAEVHTVEHILSALAGLGITDCRIEINALEVPGMDGSAADFVAAICRAGIETLPGTAVEPIIVREPIHIEEGGAKISALPHPVGQIGNLPYTGGLKISYTLNYPGHPLAQGQYELELTEESYKKEIAPARTFAIKKDAEAMRAAGLGKGANFQNTVVIEGDKALETTLRFPDEPVRHKILDLIGDLYVLGRPVQGHIVASCSGHRLNRALAAKLGGTTTD